MNALRQQVCQTTAAKLTQALGRLATSRAVVGLDGFVDEILAVVDTRHDPDRYEPVRTIAALAAKIGRAAGESSNYELVVKQRKLGGNGPIMANALACLGLPVTYIGNLGHPEIHLVFRDFATRADVRSIAEPGHTDALEFDDGKLLLGKLEPLAEVNWDNLVERVGRDELQRLFGGATLIGMVNWTMLPRMTGIWEHLLAEVLPGGGSHEGKPAPRRTLFVDLADPEKRTSEDLREALGLLPRFQEQVEVILGLNLKEAMAVARVLGLTVPADPDAFLEPAAAAIRRDLGIGCVVIHPRRAAAAATETEVARFAGPFVQHPLISTGGGDHFNAGFAFGRILGLGLEESLCAGVACSGYYVRTAQSPTAAELAEFIRLLPDPEPPA
jgi:sugar/nucleoside kinase (ribokinase family)